MGFKDEFSKYSRFIAGGGLGLLVNLAITHFFWKIIGMWFPVAYAIGLASNLVFNFIFHVYVTFRKKTGKARSFTMFAPLTLGVTFMNYVFVRIFTELVILDNLIPFAFMRPFYNYIVIIGVTFLVSLLNYYLNTKFVFANENRSN